MTPGDSNPDRYKGRSTLSKSVAGLVIAGASAGAIYHQFLHEREGERLAAYPDGKHIWTICGGLTRVNGQPVHEGMTLSKAECDRLDEEVQMQGLERMRKLATVPLSEPALAGIASFCIHNIGEAQCKTSTFLRLLNAGKRNEACAQITRWIMDGGKDCRVKRNKCGGQVERRPQEDELCLDGSR